MLGTSIDVGTITRDCYTMAGLNDHIVPSWWPDYREWLTQQAAELKPAPKTLRSRKHKARAEAPGNCVHAG